MGIYRQKKSNIFWMSKTVDGILYRQSTGTDSKMQARAVFEKWATELREKTKNGEPVITVKVKREHKAHKAITFKELAERYLEFTHGRLKSYKNLVYFVKTLKDIFNNKSLDDFTVLDLEKMQSVILAKGQSVAYANRLTAILKAMFSKALSWELITEDVIKKIKQCRQLKGENKRLRYLSDEESERLIECCDSHLIPVVVTALSTGMRKSEILGLTWRRVDMKNRVILLDTTKNGERREIPVNETLYNTLSGITRHLQCEYVFYNPETLKPYYGLNKAFERALKKAHIVDFKIHDLRHTFASRLVMRGVDLATVKELLGHKDIKMTLRYAHLAPAHLRAAVEVLDKKNSYFLHTGEKEKISKP